MTREHVFFVPASFDQRPSFSAEEVYARIEAFGDEGRRAYLRLTFTADLLFPIVLFAFLLQLMRFVTERIAGLPRRLRQLPALLTARMARPPAGT